MAFRAKPSILNRPLKNPAPNTQLHASIDVQADQEKARLEALAQKKKAMQDEALKRMFGTPEEKAEIARREAQEHERHLQIRHSLQAQAQAQEANVSAAMISAVQANLDADKEREEARKQYARQVLEENKRLIELRNKSRAEQYRSELEKDRADAARPEPWNRSLV
eukprot:tig00021293_g19998.t1